MPEMQTGHPAKSAPPATITTSESSASSGVRRARRSELTAIQKATLAFDETLTELRQGSPREWAVGLDLLRRRLERECERHAFALRRWAA